MIANNPQDLSLLLGNSLHKSDIDKVEKMGLDLRSIQSIQGEGSRQEKFKRIAVQFEEILINTLLKDAYSEEKDEDEQEEMALTFGPVRDFRIMLMSQHIADNGGLGFQEIIEQQLLNRENPEQPETATSSPIPLDGSIRTIRTISRQKEIVPPPPDPQLAYPTRPAISNRSSHPHIQTIQQNPVLQDDIQQTVEPVQAEISSDFGWRRDPIDGQSRFHNGIDLPVAPHTPVKSCMDGEVVFSGWEPGYGRLVEIKHNNGYTSRYGHNAELLVKKGDLVKVGSVIAHSGSSGRSTGPHLHFEIRKDNLAIDPVKFFKQNNTNVFAKKSEIRDVGL